LQWIRNAKAELEAEAAEPKARQRQKQANATEQEVEASRNEQRSKRASLRSRGARSPPKQPTTPHPLCSAVTPPDSHVLKGVDGWIQDYTAKAAFDGDHQVILAIG
jgi:sRNA-binding protein